MAKTGDTFQKLSGGISPWVYKKGQEWKFWEKNQETAMDWIVSPSSQIHMLNP